MPERLLAVGLHPADIDAARRAVALDIGGDIARLHGGSVRTVDIDIALDAGDVNIAPGVGTVDGGTDIADVGVGAVVAVNRHREAIGEAGGGGTGQEDGDQGLLDGFHGFCSCEVFWVWVVGLPPGASFGIKSTASFGALLRLLVVALDAADVA